MVFKCLYSCYEPPRQTREIPSQIVVPVPKILGRTVVSLGNKDGKFSAERAYKIDSPLLAYNLEDKKVLVKVSENDEKFDVYLGMPFTKGVTERGSGRTLLILGSSAHHIEAMQEQFDGVLYKKEGEKEIKKYGDCVRWINVGDVKNGFVGLDYNPKARKNDGVARSVEDISFLAQTLIEFGFDEKKRLFLLKPPYIIESEEGIRFREKGLEKLADYARTKV